MASRPRVCLIYDCLYPHTVGGAERWLRNLAERLVAEGYPVTYLTLRQWEGDDAGVPGVEVIAVGPRMTLYAGSRRKVLPPLIFGAGAFLHLLRRGHRYRIVHTTALSFFAVLAAGAVRPLRRYRLIVDWFEVWTRAYWREYLGPVAGWVGWRIQRLTARVPHQAFSFSRLHMRRLREEGFRGSIVPLRGLYDGTTVSKAHEVTDPVVLFAGRLIPEKGVRALVRGFALARRDLPELRLEILGDGPERPGILRLIEEGGLRGAARAPGFVDEAEKDEAMSRALCLALPSRREGYGLVVIEAAARGTPTLVVRSPDNAAVELVEDGVNGVIADSDASEDLANAIRRVYEAGPGLRASTVEWFRRRSGALSLEGSLAAVLEAYAGGQGDERASP